MREMASCLYVSSVLLRSSWTWERCRVREITSCLEVMGALLSERDGMTFVRVVSSVEMFRGEWGSVSVQRRHYDLLFVSKSSVLNNEIPEHVGALLSNRGDFCLCRQVSIDEIFRGDWSVVGT